MRLVTASILIVRWDRPWRRQLEPPPAAPRRGRPPARVPIPSRRPAPNRHPRPQSTKAGAPTPGFVALANEPGPNGHSVGPIGRGWQHSSPGARRVATYSPSRATATADRRQFSRPPLQPARARNPNNCAIEALSPANSDSSRPWHRYLDTWPDAMAERAVIGAEQGEVAQAPPNSGAPTPSFVALANEPEPNGDSIGYIARGSQHSTPGAPRVATYSPSPPPPDAPKRPSNPTEAPLEPPEPTPDAPECTPPNRPAKNRPAKNRPATPPRG
jgi:hypothetical protein